jgi:hypothetical protein
MKAGKIILTILGLIALYLVLSNGNAFNTALKTVTDSSLKGVAVLQGRNAKDAL